MAEAGAQDRLGRLLGFLEQDPDNAMLLRDAAEAALDAGEPARAVELYARLRDTGELTGPDSNQWAIAAMGCGEPERAAETFAGLLAQRPDDIALKFNLAWARSLAGDMAGARDALSAEAIEALPQAALLDIKLLHSAGEFDEAVRRAKEHLARHGDDPSLLAALSTLALDVEDVALARDCAQRAGDHPEALAALATLALGDQEVGRAKAMFEQSLAMDARSPRAWVGLGLSELLQGNGASAAEHLDKGAELFGDHLGSWIAAGWAWLIAGDRAKARERFERAVSIDGNFGEAQGSLAVVELLDGEKEAALRRIEVAARLDRQSFSAAFAKMLVSAGEGDTATAQRILDLALRQPIGDDGRTLADAITRMSR